MVTNEQAREAMFRGIRERMKCSTDEEIMKLVVGLEVLRGDDGETIKAIQAGFADLVDDLLLMLITNLRVTLNVAVVEKRSQHEAAATWANTIPGERPHAR
jgi:hypothetical protein